MNRKYYPLRVLTSFLIDKNFDHACENVLEIQFFKGSLWTNISTKEDCIHRSEITYALKRLDIPLDEFFTYCQENEERIVAEDNDEGA